MLLSVGFVCGLLFEKRAWNLPRFCPRLPIWSKLKNPYETFLYRSLFPLLVLIALSVNPVWSIVALVALAGFSCACDCTRFRPWLYQYSFMLMAMALAHRGGSDGEALNICRLITISIYFWAGVHKINASFFQGVFPNLMKPLEARFGIRLAWLGYPVPFAEAVLALGLLFPQTRLLSLAGVVFMHCFILLCFSRWGQSNRTVWPWNVTMMLASVVLFGHIGSVGCGDILVGQQTLLHQVVLLLFLLFPVLGLFDAVDLVLSHAHMCGRHMWGFVSITQLLYANLPEEVRHYCRRRGYGRGQIFVLDLGNWYIQEVDLPHPQQEWLLRCLARDFARYGARDNDLNLTVFRRPGFFSTTIPQKVYTWSELWADTPTGMPL